MENLTYYNHKAHSAFSLMNLWFNKLKDFSSEPISEANLKNMPYIINTLLAFRKACKSQTNLEMNVKIVSDETTKAGY